mmetsp:Transcript_17319/g.46747  ORF Transcript_17319/g.46747 Transcript_17319/m.46747 type:complete len:248 (+) Transcript_17319:360-1103(+)
MEGCGQGALDALRVAILRRLLAKAAEQEEGVVDGRGEHSGEHHGGRKVGHRNGLRDGPHDKVGTCSRGGDAREGDEGEAPGAHDVEEGDQSEGHHLGVHLLQVVRHPVQGGLEEVGLACELHLERVGSRCEDVVTQVLGQQARGVARQGHDDQRGRGGVGVRHVVDEGHPKLGQATVDHNEVALHRRALESSGLRPAHHRVREVVERGANHAALVRAPHEHRHRVLGRREQALEFLVICVALGGLGH